MTKKELIKKLEKYPDDLKIYKGINELKQFWTIEVEEIYADTKDEKQYIIIK